MGKRVTVHTDDGQTSTVQVDSDKDAREYEDMVFRPSGTVQWVRVTDDTEGGRR